MTLVVRISIVVAGGAGLCSALNLADLGLSSMRTGFEEPFALLLFALAFIHSILSIWLLAARSVKVLMPFVAFSALTACLDLIVPVTIQSIRDVIGIVAFGSGLTSLVIVVLHRRIFKTKSV